jgi:hypothetical protein
MDKKSKWGAIQFPIKIIDALETKKIYFVQNKKEFYNFKK